MLLPSLSQLTLAHVHLGHKIDQWNPKMLPYIYMANNGIHIIDLVKTSECIKKATIFCNQQAKNKKKFLFVGTKPQMSLIVASAAKKCNSFYINYRWLGGMLSNWKTIKTRIKRLNILEQQEKDGSFQILPKKEIILLRNELFCLRQYFNGIKNMLEIPDVIIVIDQFRDLTAIKEAIRYKIPIISILDTNCNPDLSNIIIPSNDDSTRAISLILDVLGESINEGRLESKK